MFFVWKELCQHVLEKSQKIKECEEILKEEISGVRRSKTRSVDIAPRRMLLSIVHRTTIGHWSTPLLISAGQFFLWFA